ncbi:AbrB family looped-hinge helix DNA binding protein [Rhodoblastus acidophilus]|uniref:AbrB/MazE/SpoVT family DNA-binding domain-containing protein n=1 Tax=Rhodoblastus acidophilus TaxID=1074 RepID=UPI002223FA1D|nr:AbrB/MazE/SpoVT family DNA-binding domain-containing protein [Rhodoblastus acidophilus]MCW2283933.1 AbrB family looped-hinge helix DNA binding protein [Rhodoblastus acidophilus]MCW2332629.1 AbrB family looped-hinge helix DNA binding protein [Rhodoblastus acidophilus]
MATTVTVKGQVTLPKAVRDAAGIKPGDRVEVRAAPGGGILIEREQQAPADVDAFRRQLQEVARRQPFRGGPLTGMTSDEIMQLLRGEE